MNKTVLLACCDFLILATLALTSFKSKPADISENQFQPDNSFHISEVEEAQEDLVEAFYKMKLKQTNEQLMSTQKELSQSERELVNQKLLNQDKDNQLRKLKLKLNQQSRSVFKSVLNNLWQVNVSMQEDDSFSPDSFKTGFFSCAFTLNKQTYLLTEFNKLGFNWQELIADGNINKLNITLAKTGPNPWSTVCKGPILSLNQAPAVCLINIPSTRVYEPLSVLPFAKLPDYLEKIYAAKSDGRVIKVKNVSIIPTKPDWIVIDEERFLGHPDKVETGDALITSDGALIGIVSNEIRSGNKSRLMCLTLSKLKINESEKIPLTRDKGEIYYQAFVNKVRELAKKQSGSK